MRENCPAKLVFRSADDEFLLAFRCRHPANHGGPHEAREGDCEYGMESSGTQWAITWWSADQEE